MIGLNILIVEDEEKLRKLIAAYFKREMANVFEAKDGREALEVWNERNYHMVILDIMLPEYDGWTVCNRMRDSSDVPIIFLTSRSEEEDKLFGFDLGADDYMTKPFSPKELIARAKALLKRSHQNSQEEIICIDSLKIDKKTHQVFLADEELHLTPKEYDLLLFFIQHKNQALSRSCILDGVWGFDYYGDLRTVDTHVKRLRKKLLTFGGQILTIRSFGYRLEVSK